MNHVDCESNIRSVVRSTMHPCLGNSVLIGRAVVYYARIATHLVQEFNAGTVPILAHFIRVVTDSLLINEE